MAERRIQSLDAESAVFDSGCGHPTSDNSNPKETKEMSESTEEKQPPILFSEQQIAEFKQTHQAISEAFVDYAQIKGITWPHSYELKSISDWGITFGYIEWGYEPRYDGWEEHEETMPIEFLTDPGYRAQLIAEETAKREQAEREKAEKKRAAAEAKRREQEEKDRFELARLLEQYPDTAAELQAGRGDN